MQRGHGVAGSHAHRNNQIHDAALVTEIETFLDEQRESIRRTFLLAANSLGTEESFLDDLFIRRSP